MTHTPLHFRQTDQVEHIYMMQHVIVAAHWSNNHWWVTLSTHDWGNGMSSITLPLTDAEWRAHPLHAGE